MGVDMQGEVLLTIVMFVYTVYINIFIKRMSHEC
jgi:hypothetical protein